MPSKNVDKTFVNESYYHIYNHGVYNQQIFVDNEDYRVFLNLFKRYLSKAPARDRTRRSIAHLRDHIQLLAYCLMPNHFHLLVYNVKERGITELMHRVMTSYSMYFNKRYKRKGVLFQNTYKASLINDDAYLWHISRYIHLNPQDLNKEFSTYSFSSYPYYLGQKQAEWLNPDKVLALHKHGLSDYADFVKDYEAMRAELQQLKHLLAD